MAGVFRGAMERAIAARTIEPREDCSHAALAHIFGAIGGLLSGGLLIPIAAPTLVLLFHSSRNPFVLFHVNQAAWFQGLVSAIQIGTGVLAGLLALFTCGFGTLILLPLLPVFIVGWLVSVALPAYVAFRAYRGEWTPYPYLGDWVLDQESPLVVD